MSSPALGANGVVYVGSQDHNLYALDASNAAYLELYDGMELSQHWRWAQMASYTLAPTIATCTH